MVLVISVTAIVLAIVLAQNGCLLFSALTQ
ncbi:hypothetical protein BH10ACI1_BH10ACI1_18210 [soil metagenome]